MGLIVEMMKRDDNHGPLLGKYFEICIYVNFDR